MSEEIKSEMISRRRAFSLLGLAALCLAVPATILTVSDAEAETVVMTPRAKRQARRHMRREARRRHRHMRRAHRRAVPQ